MIIRGAIERSLIKLSQNRNNKLITIEVDIFLPLRVDGGLGVGGLCINIWFEADLDTSMNLAWVISSPRSFFTARI